MKKEKKEKHDIEQCPVYSIASNANYVTGTYKV